MLVTFFHVSHNTQMLGIKYAYLMTKKLKKIILNLKKIKIKKFKIDYEEKIEKNHLEQERR